MGMFDTFISKDESVQVQLKTGPCVLNAYREGESVNGELKDGVYVAPDGCVVIRNGIVEQVTEDKTTINLGGLQIFSKWGDSLGSLNEDVDDLNPIAQAVKAVAAKYEGQNE